MRKNIEEQVQENTENIAHIKNSIDTIKNNHLFHLEKDMEKQSKAIEKIDNRIWWILGLLVTGIVIPALIKGIF